MLYRDFENELQPCFYQQLEFLYKDISKNNKMDTPRIIDCLKIDVFYKLDKVQTKCIRLFFTSIIIFTMIFHFINTL